MYFFIWSVEIKSVPIVLNAGASSAGLPDAYFENKNPNLGKFWRVLQWKMLVNFMAIWSTYFMGHLVYFVAIWYTYFMVIGYIWQPWSSVELVVKMQSRIYR
jgi:hypothetical protein